MENTFRAILSDCCSILGPQRWWLMHTEQLGFWKLCQDSNGSTLKSEDYGCILQQLHDMDNQEYACHIKVVLQQCLIKSLASCFAER